MNNWRPPPTHAHTVRLAHSVDDFKQGTLAEALELLEKKVYLTEEGAANMIERIWCFEDHCPTPALGFYEGNLQWAKEVRLFVYARKKKKFIANTPRAHAHTHTHSTNTFTYT